VLLFLPLLMLQRLPQHLLMQQRLLHRAMAQLNLQLCMHHRLLRNPIVQRHLQLLMHYSLVQQRLMGLRLLAEGLLHSWPGCDRCDATRSILM